MKKKPQACQTHCVPWAAKKSGDHYVDAKKS
jgi:hypothetical protein